MDQIKDSMKYYGDLVEFSSLISLFSWFHTYIKGEEEVGKKESAPGFNKEAQHGRNMMRCNHALPCLKCISLASIIETYHLVSFSTMIH